MDWRKQNDWLLKSLVALISAVGFLSLLLFVLRLSTLLYDYDMIVTTWSEEECIYPIWKVVNGARLYEAPDVYPYSATVYNFLFAQFYGHVLSVLGINGEGILLWGRAITLGFAVAGGTAQFLLIRHLMDDADSKFSRWIALAIVLLTWCNPILVGWHSVSMRVDVPAVATATIGLLVFVKALRTNRAVLYLVASLVFFCAWGFKQTYVGAITGICLYLIYQRQFRNLLLMAVPCLSLMALTFLFGGETYWHNVIEVPRLFPWSASLAFEHVTRILLSNSLPWMVVLGIVAFRARGLHSFLVWVNVTASLFALLFLFRVGSSVTYALEPVVAGLTLLPLLLAELHERVRPRFAAAALMLSTFSLLPLLGLLLSSLLGSGGFLGLDRISTADYQKRQAVAAIVRDAPKPIYTSDPILSQPWISTANTYPALPLSYYYYNNPNENWNIKLKDGGISRLIERKHFGSLLLPAESGLAVLALREGYRAEERVTLPNVFHKRSDEFVLLYAPNVNTELPNSRHDLQDIKR